MIDEKKRLLVQRYANSLKPNYLRIYRDILIGYLMLIFGILFSLKVNFAKNILFGITSYLLISIWIGIWIHYLGEFLHEASHYNLAKDRKINDLLANIFMGSWIGFTVQSYRAGHFAHHKYLGTKKDPENSYFNKLDTRFIFESLFLIRIFKYFKAKLFNNEMNAMQYDSVVDYPIKIFEFIFALLFQFMILFTIGKQSLISGISWATGFYVFFPFIASIRQLLEHRHPNADKSYESYLKKDQGVFTRNFGDNIFALIIGGAGFNRHFYHHLFPNISYTKLKELEIFCKDNKILKFSLKNDSYNKVFFRLFEI